MKRNEAISKIMTTDIKTVHIRQNVSEVRHMLAENPIHHVPVMSGQKLVGMLSATDMLRLSFEAYGADDRSIDAILDHQFKIEDVMQKELTTLSRTATVRDAAEVLQNGSFHSLPVVDEAGDLVGLVTSTDLIHYLLSQY